MIIEFILCSLILFLIIVLIFYFIFHNKMNKLNAEYKNVSNQLEQSKEHLNNTIHYNEQYEAELKENEKQYEALEQKQHELLEQLASLTSEINVKKEYLEYGLKQLEESRTKELEQQIQTFQETNNNLKKNAQQEMDIFIQECDDKIDKLQSKYLSILNELKQIEKEKQEQLYYTIQIPNEYKDDIEYLLVEVTKKIEHPQIVNKLVWSEYIKPRLDETCARANIIEESGIYKITSLIDGKSYIGKSTNMKTRIMNHFKSAVGISSIADQLIHHAIIQQGLWNWRIEPLAYCNKEDLNENEKFYINFFKTQEYGYNRKEGG